MLLLPLPLPLPLPLLFFELLPLPLVLDDLDLPLTTACSEVAGDDDTCEPLPPLVASAPAPPAALLFGEGVAAAVVAALKNPVMRVLWPAPLPPPPTPTPRPPPPSCAATAAPPPFPPFFAAVVVGGAGATRGLPLLVPTSVFRLEVAVAEVVVAFVPPAMPT